MSALIEDEPSARQLGLNRMSDLGLNKADDGREDDGHPPIGRQAVGALVKEALKQPLLEHQCLVDGAPNLPLGPRGIEDHEVDGT